jgi:hypothetical protein
MCPIESDIEEPLAQLWVGDELGAAGAFPGVSVFAKVRTSAPLVKYLGEVRLQRFRIGRLTAEADIAVGTDHIQTCTPSSIAVV